jgi:hypothetical protein
MCYILMNAQNNLPFDETKTAELINTMTALLKALTKSAIETGVIDPKSAPNIKLQKQGRPRKFNIQNLSSEDYKKEYRKLYYNEHRGKEIYKYKKPEPKTCEHCGTTVLCLKKHYVTLKCLEAKKTIIFEKISSINKYGVEKTKDC